MIADSPSLVAALRKQLAVLKSDLQTRCTLPDADGALRSQWRAARAAARTPATYGSWRDDQVAQEAAAWLLGTVFLRFCEDNGLIAEPYLSGRGERFTFAEDRRRRFRRSNPHATDRDWLLAGLEELNANQVLAPLLDPDRGPPGRLGLSVSTAEDLIAFWRTRENGEVIYDFTDPQWSTGFLGDLYQDLSDQQRSKYALLETPDFIAEFILDHTLEPAIQEFGLDDLRVVDPVCGSGTFLLAALQRLLHHWRNRATAPAPSDLVQRCLRSVHGVDKHPIAVAITRFRLVIEAMKACGAKALIDAPELRVIAVAGDSLLLGRGAPEPPGHVLDLGTAEQECLAELSGADLLGAHSYHAVFGNPPYITPKDKAEAEAYRAAYPDCVGSYALTIPFIERFFALGVRGNAGRAGHIGLLVANSFMKRDFGRNLVERFFPTVELTHVIDTAGVFIPGHGTPTAILLGRSRQPQDVTAEVIAGLRGEPQVPADPAHGIVWRSILGGIGHTTHKDNWIQVLDVDRAILSVFPWNFADKATGEILNKMERGTRLGDRVIRIGYYASTGSDEIFTAPSASFRRIKAETEPLIPIITGSEVRDWRVLPETAGALFSEADKGSLASKDFPRHLRRLWPYKTVLELRRNYTGRSYFEDGRLWYGWHHISETPGAHPWSIIFPWVSTHNHFAVLRDRAAPLSSAPVIRLPRAASDSDVVQLASLLNSSLACFWLKHYSNSKGQPRADQTGTGEPWTLFYEFTGTRLADFPLPPDRWSGDRWSVHAEQLDWLARELTATAPQILLKPDSVIPLDRLDDAHARWERARARIVGLQEELDWEIYGRYGLVSGEEDLLAPEDAVPDLMAGGRAFEIVLARSAARGEVNTTWFERNGIKPVTQIPDRWPARYRRVVENRIRAIEQLPAIGLVERPEFKRRWSSAAWEVQERDAIRLWLLDRCERRNLWYERGHDGELQPHPQTLKGLSERLGGEEDFVAMASRFAGKGVELDKIIAEIARDEHVPYLAALRYMETGLRKYAQWVETWRLRGDADETGNQVSIAMPPKYVSEDFLKSSYWRLRKKFDVLNERFISYSYAVPDDELVLGWAGWSHSERARVLVNLIEARNRNSDDHIESIIPLLAGLRELLPWLRQWHRTPEPPLWRGNPLNEVREYLEQEQSARGLSDDDLTGWRPPKPKRGRPRKRH
jgi:hypothetical protein